MKKVSKIAMTSFTGILCAAALAGCNKQGADLLMWTGFGGSYTMSLEEVLGDYTAETGVSIEHQSQKGYDNLQNNMNNSIATESYPNFANGYPDHFANYINNEIQVPLDDYIEKYNEEHGTDLLKDYYEQYMVENQTLAYDESGKGITYALPFNKSTEVMGYNNFFVQYAIKQDPSIATTCSTGIVPGVPTTWDEVRAVGPRYTAVMQTLGKPNEDTLGKWVYGTADEQHPENILPDSWEVVDAIADEKGEDHAPANKKLLIDCSRVELGKFRPFSWDSADNMFITIVRQWGGIYTEYTKDDIQIGHGWARFYDADVKAKTIAACEFFKSLNADHIFALPSELASTASFSSDSFRANQCIFTVCSSGGLSYNIKEDGSGRKFRVAPIPYHEADKKYVISQGTNLAVFDQGSKEDQQKSFEVIVALTTGELQGKWAVETGYYPASRSATNSEAYQNLINNPPKNETDAAYQESAQVNNNYYMAVNAEHPEFEWEKFVDPGFMGSSIIRSEVGKVMAIIFKGDKTVEETLQTTYDRISQYHR